MFDSEYHINHPNRREWQRRNRSAEPELNLLVRPRQSDSVQALIRPSFRGLTEDAAWKTYRRMPNHQK